MFNSNHSIKFDLNINTKKLLKSAYFCQNLDKPTEISLKKFQLITLIRYYTKLEEKSLLKTLLNIYFTRIYNLSFNDIIYNEKEQTYEYKFQNGERLIFDMISRHIEDKDLIKELTSKRRNHKCHIRSLELSQWLDNSKVLTGYIIIGDLKILHSVVEVTINGKKIILDWTKNIEMSKNDYQNLFQFTILSSIESTDVLEDMYLFEELAIDFSTKTYLIFRDEIMNDFAKNEQLFKNKTLTKKR